MTAVLCRHFGLEHMEVAEDIASDTFLKASENWAIHGIPDNPAAWLYTVARNKAKDYSKHRAVFNTKVRPALQAPEPAAETAFEFSSQQIADSQLAMIFAVCHPANAADAQVCLALQILCGFSVVEIANAFLTKPETVKKRLQRARARLRRDNFSLRALSRTEVSAREDTVLKTLYLLFNEGYFSKTGNQLIRKDLCSEAMRLALVLTENPWTDTPQANALLALMCFQSSRLDARVNGEGEAVLFDEQDKSRWDQAMIARGNSFLVRACRHNAVSKYHLEAGIAYWHTTEEEHKWRQILQLYNQLILVEYSPVTALNRIFALARVYGAERAIQEAEKLSLEERSDYHALLGYLHAGRDRHRAAAHYEEAIRRTTSKAERQALRRRIAGLQEGA